MIAPDFDALAREWMTRTIYGHTLDAMEGDGTLASLSALLRSVHASRDAEVKAAREQGIREAADAAARPSVAGEDPPLVLTMNEAVWIQERILALLNAPKGG